MMMKKLVLILCIAPALIFGQKRNYTEQDSLRGSIGPDRAWWDLQYYHLSVDVDPQNKYLSGQNLISYKVIDSGSTMQIDLQPPLKIDAILQDGEDLTFRSKGNAHFIDLKKPQQIGSVNTVIVAYSGNPREADFAPWDGGFSWAKDRNGKDFVATSCQGIGASIWWPNKDHMYDEVDSMRISITAPRHLVGVGNGRLESVEETDAKKTYHWFVSNPINNYCVNVNIGDYVNFSEVYEGEKGPLDLDYYVLRDNLEKAKVQFEQASMTIEAFEYWFGPYPFYEDSFKLVEVPYLGMEHQSSVTYGNQYQNGYLGRDLSGTGWGLEFDFIIVHEAGHEWFANNITYKDIADMWVHEGFTAYSENLYLDYHFGREASAAYVVGTRSNIRNDRPVIGDYGVNKRGSSDMYYKGSNMLHTLRQLIEDDELWRSVLRGLNEEFFHQTVETEEIENYISEKTGKDLTAFFNQYLRSTEIPMLEYKIEEDSMSYRYTHIVDDFDMPVRLFVDKEEKWIYPSASWKSESLGKTSAALEFDPNFYIRTKELK